MESMMGRGLFLSLLLCVAACGGGSGASPLQAPGAIQYEAAQFKLPTDTPIALHATVTGDMPTQWSVDPALPAGLTLDGQGSISGVPALPVPLTGYVVTGENEAGQSSATLQIEVVWADFRSLLPKTNLTDAEIRHFLERTHFGFSLAPYNSIQQIGLAGHVELMTTFTDTDFIEDQAFEFLRTLAAPDGDFPGPDEVAMWALHLMANNSNPFQEVLAFHWHNHFATGPTPTPVTAKWMTNHMNLWRKGGVGNLRTLLIDMSRDWSMLAWLNGIENDAGTDQEPNENFAREYFELYCLGVDVVYTEADIREAARAFSGYRTVAQLIDGRFQEVVVFDWMRHDPGQKQLFGQVIAAQPGGSGEHDDYEAVVDITLGLSDPATGAPRVGQWIIRNLIESVCFDDPPQNVIDDLAIQLRNDNWKLRPMIRRLLQSEMFFSAKARVGRVKGPTDYLIGFMRATNLTIRADEMLPKLIDLKHVPTRPPSVNGWPGGSNWLSAQAMINTANVLHRVTRDAHEDQQLNGVYARALIPHTNATAAEMVDSLTLRLQVTLNPAERARAIQLLETDPDLADSPWDPNFVVKAESRIRSLLWVLGQHPTYLVR